MKRREFLKGILSLGALFLPKGKEESDRFNLIHSGYGKGHLFGFDNIILTPKDGFGFNNVAYHDDGIGWDVLPAVPIPFFIVGENGVSFRSDDGCATWQEIELESICGRCGDELDIAQSETCFYCGDILCYDCWDKYGHCGHLEAERQNELARQGKLHNGYVCSNLGCSSCLAVGCESRKYFSGIDHLIQTGYQDAKTESKCNAIESVIGGGIVIDCQELGTTSSELLRILKSTDGCVGEIKIHYGKCS